MYNNRREQIANEIVDDIISTRGGQGLMYDEEILDMYTTDYFINEMEEIKQIVDEKMHEHLDEDNLTIL